MKKTRKESLWNQWCRERKVRLQYTGMIGKTIKTYDATWHDGTKIGRIYCINKQLVG